MLQHVYWVNLQLSLCNSLNIKCSKLFLMEQRLWPYYTWLVWCSACLEMAWNVWSNTLFFTSAKTFDLLSLFCNVLLCNCHYLYRVTLLIVLLTFSFTLYSTWFLSCLKLQIAKNSNQPKFMKITFKICLLKHFCNGRIHLWLGML